MEHMAERWEQRLGPKWMRMNCWKAACHLHEDEIVRCSVRTFDCEAIPSVVADHTLATLG